VPSRSELHSDVCHQRDWSVGNVNIVLNTHGNVGVVLNSHAGNVVGRLANKESPGHANIDVGCDVEVETKERLTRNCSLRVARGEAESRSRQVGERDTNTRAEKRMKALYVWTPDRIEHHGIGGKIEVAGR
jgi:hypothetical protein